MKRSQLVWIFVAVVAIASWATAFACKDKQASAAASNCPATASCPANSAQCAHAKGAAVTADVQCPYHHSTSGAAAVTADMRGAAPMAAGACNHESGAAAASAEGGCSHDKAAMASGACSMHGSAAAAANANNLCAHDKAAMAAGECPMHGSAAMAAGASGCDHAKGAAAAAGACMFGGAAAAGCPGHEVTTAMGRHAEDADCANCVSCADMAKCEKELESAGTVTQVVRLKNGVMYVYTADSPAKVRTVQAALARRGDQWTRLASADKARLCPPCKEMRGAAASGKLSRETVNIEGGCLTLMTSNDPTVVKKIYAMAGLPNNGTRAKS